MNVNKLENEIERLNVNIEKMLKESKKERIKNCIFWLAFLVFLIILGTMEWGDNMSILSKAIKKLKKIVKGGK